MLEPVPECSKCCDDVSGTKQGILWAAHQLQFRRIDTASLVTKLTTHDKAHGHSLAKGIPHNRLFTIQFSKLLSQVSTL